MFESGLYQLLRDNPGVNALVSGRIFGIRAPKDPGFPCVVWTVVSTVDLYTISGPEGYRTKRIQLDSYATAYSTAVKVSDAVRAALTPLIKTALPDGTSVDSTIVITDQDFPYEPGASGQIFRHMLEVEISYHE